MTEELRSNTGLFIIRVKETTICWTQLEL